MKKVLLSISLVVLLLLSVPFYANAETDKYYVVDNADIIFDTNEEQLENDLRAISESTGMDVVVVTTNTLEGKTPEAYADDYYDYNGYDDDGCLFLISMEDRDWHVSTRGYAITCITDYGIRVIEDSCVSLLSNGDYYLACHKYGQLVEEFYNEAKADKPYNTNHLYKDADGNVLGKEESSFSIKGALISLIVSLIIAFVIIGMVKKSYKPVRFNANASNYLVDGSLNVTQSYEHFLYSHVSKTERQSSSGGGSSTHTSSSGSTHGGGGGKF